MKRILIFYGLLSVVVSQQRPLNQRCLNDPTINPELCMQSFSKILADANNLRPRKNPVLGKISPYLNDEFGDSIGEDDNLINFDEVLKELDKYEVKKSKQTKISNNLKEIPSNTLNLIKSEESSKSPISSNTLDIGIVEKEKPTTFKKQKLIKISKKPKKLPLLIEKTKKGILDKVDALYSRNERPSIKKSKRQSTKTKNEEEALKLLRLALSKLGLSESSMKIEQKKKPEKKLKLARKMKTDDNETKTEEKKKAPKIMKINKNEKILEQISKDPLDELNEVIKSLEISLRKAIKITQKRNRKILRRKIRNELKKAQRFDNLIASKIINETPEVLININKRKRSIRNAIALSQSLILTEDKIKDLRHELNEALGATVKFKDLTNEALSDDEADDEPMSEFMADDQAVLNVLKDIQKTDDAQLIGKIRRMAISNKIEGKHVQTSQSVNEINNRRLTFNNNVHGMNVQTKIDVREEKNTPVKSSDPGNMNFMSDGRRANVNQQSNVQQHGGENKNEQSKIQQNGGKNQNKQSDVQQTGGSNMNSQNNVQQRGESNKNEQNSIQQKSKNHQNQMQQNHGGGGSESSFNSGFSTGESSENFKTFGSSSGGSSEDTECKD